MHEDVQSNLYLQEQENQPPTRRKRRSDTTDRYMVDFNEIDARLVDTLNQPSDSTSTNASATTASAKKGRKSATPANQHFITDYFRPPAASATTPLSASQPTSHVIKQESIVDEGFDRDPEQSQPHDNQSIVSSQGLGQSQQEHYYIAPPPPRTPQKRKPVRAPAIVAGFQTPERGRRGAVLEVPSSTPGLSPITKASLSAAAMAAAGLRDLSFVSPTPRARWRGAAPVVPPFRITRSHHARRQSSNDSDAAAKIGSVVAMSVWEDYEEVGIGGGCETGSETDEDYISDEHVPTAANLQKPSLQRDRPVLSGLSQLQPTQGRARAPQYEKELHLSSSSSGHSDHNNISGAEAENDIKLVHGNQLDPESDNENEEMLGTKAASESICSTVISIRSPLPMSDANDDYDYDNEDENGNIANDADDNDDDDDDDDDGDYDARSAIFSSLEFPCAQRASDSIYSHEGSSSDHGEEEAGSGYSSSRKKAGSSGGRAAGAAPGAEANGHHDDNHDDEIGSSADDEVLRAWAEQRQRGPPALLLLESRYDPVDDRSLVADSEAAAAVMAAVAAEDDDDDLFSLPLQPRLRYRSSQFPSQSQSQSLMRSDSTTTTTTAGGGSRRGGERYLYSTQRPIDFDNDTEPEDEDMFDADRAGPDKLANGNMTESQQQTEDQQGQQLQQEQRHLNRRQEFAMPLTQYQQVSQALPITSTQQQHQEHQPLQTLINEPSPSTQYYVDRILTTSMLESLPLPELLPTSPAYLQLHQPHHRRANRK
ncbi:hypothetical protein D0Z00_001072 [Geotrichum galactomycetum]|uniref:Uncharacterized protein n=1 Tax=Geotrichum galactomycetum TaxID=27317 RepID=A0ACB6V838_9ASCO|nr:hypothetical protein D0Z00_001072 [Geotrichum candidum]